MPKPPVDNSQVLSAQVEYPFTNESLLCIHHQHGLKGDPDSFVSDVRLAYRTYRLARDAFVTAKEHHQQFDRLAKSPSKYLKTLRSQELTWLKRAGWNGDLISVQDFIDQARSYIPSGQDSFSDADFGRRLATIWLNYGGSKVKYKSLNVTKDDQRDYSGFPLFIEQMLGYTGRIFCSTLSIKSYINQIWPSEK